MTAAGGVERLFVMRGSRMALLTALLVGLLSTASTPGLAVPGPGASFSSLRADVWPEHDDPRVLVIYRGTLSPQTPLPHTLAFSVPAGAVVHAAAYSRDGQLLTAKYQTARSGDQVQITFAVPVPDFQFEYYLDVISPPPQRAFEVSVVFPLPVADLQISVEQPLRASDFSLDPPAGRTAVSGAFTYHFFAEQAWPAGRPWTVRASYRKADATPSLAPAPPATTPPPAEGGRPLLAVITAVLGMVVGVVGALLVGLLRRPKAGRTGGAPTSKRSGRQDRFCPTCGHRVGHNDRFCANCGEVL